jgi:prepilin-type N-terminal cleavage/methylation domain-containing protein
MSPRLRIRRRLARRPGGARAGFTLVELIMAIMLLTIGMIAMAGVLSSSSRLQKISQSRGEMTTLAEAKLEELRSYGSSAPGAAIRANLAVGGSRTSSVTGYSDVVTGVSGQTFRRRWEIVNGIAGTRELRLRVEPVTLSRGQIARLDFTTLVYLRL